MTRGWSVSWKFEMVSQPLTSCFAYSWLGNSSSIGPTWTVTEAHRHVVKMLWIWTIRLSRFVWFFIEIWMRGDHIYIPYRIHCVGWRLWCMFNRYSAQQGGNSSRSFHLSPVTANTDQNELAKGVFCWLATFTVPHSDTGLSGHDPP